MLFPSPEKQELRNGVMRDLKTGKIDLAAAVERLAQIGDDPLVCALRGQASKAAGDVDGAEAWYWKGMALQPAEFTFYSLVAELRRRRDLRDELGLRLQELALRKLGDLPEIDEAVAKDFRKGGGNRELDFRDPETYQMLATVMEIEREKAHRLEGGDEDDKDAPEVLERLLPYILLSDLQHQATTVVDFRVVRKIIQNAGQCAPLFYAALRDWVRLPAPDVAPKAVAMFLAIAGEIGEAGLALDLLEISLGPVDKFVFLHAHWAVFRLGERFPAEVLAAFRTRAADAPLALRCGIAEHLVMLPEEVDIRPVAYALIEGFRSFAKSKRDDAAYLLLTVAFALESLDEDEGARLITDFGPMLSKRSQKWLTREVEEEGGFIPALMNYGLDELDIEAVCVERVLMEEEESDSEGEEDEFDDAEEEFPVLPVIGPQAAPRRPERNDPCWCGSGKKYKKCHMSTDHEADRHPAAAAARKSPPENDNQMHKRLGNLVLTAAHEWNGEAEMKRAFARFFGSTPDQPTDEEAGDLFLQWYLHDYRPRNTGPTPFAEYLRREGSHLNARERAMVEAMRDARYGLYEVQRVEEGRGIEVRNVFRGDLLFVKDITASKELVKWDCLLTRVEFFEGVYVFAGNGQLVPRTFLEPLKEFIESKCREAKQEPAEFIEANSHLVRQEMVELQKDYVKGLRVTGPTGEPMEFSSASYKIAGAVPAVLAGLRKIDGVLDDTSAKDPVGHYHFTWVEVAKGPVRPLGDIDIANSHLRLSCASRRSLERCRGMLEEALGRLLRHEEDRFESVQEALALMDGEPSRKARPEPPKSLDPEVENEIVLKAKAEHYTKWVDESLPALGGETPREAVRSEDGRRKVRDLVRGIENIEQRERRQGRPALDLAELRQTLGITED